MTIKIESTFADSDIEKAILSGDIERAEITINSLEKEVDKKSFVDCLLRNRLIHLIASKCPTGEIIDLLSFAFSLARKDLCSKALLASLLGDILDTSTVEQCELIFGFVEDHLNDWKKVCEILLRKFVI
uniref:Uncharacterized protein n=1 Tax=Romanomermis culicivorax TaxID=13658 RepID=A0A915KVH1_ROMCU